MLTRAIIVVVLLLGLLVSATTVSPVRLQAAQSDAMAPTINQNDVYLVGDAGTIESGDVIFFWSPVRGEFLTRRVVERTDAGYITKADGASTTDQANGLSPVPRSGIVGEVVSVGGRLAVLPGLAGPISAVTQFTLELLGLLVALTAFLISRGRQRYERDTGDRRVWRIKDIALAVFLVGLIVSVALTPLGASSFQVTFIATEDGGESRYTVPVGETVTRTLSLPVDRQPFSRVVVRSDGLTIEEWRWTAEGIEVTASVPAKAATGRQPAAIQVFPYPAVLPRDLLEQLHELHPIVAILGSVAALLGLPLLLYGLFVDGNRPIRPRQARRTRR
ncbi:MAG: S24/S26 family peptidase [Halobacteriales archaeon]